MSNKTELMKDNTPVQQIPNQQQKDTAQLPVQSGTGNAETLGMRRTYSAPAADDGNAGKTETAVVPHTEETLRQQLIAVGIDPDKLYEYSQKGGYTQDLDTALAGGGTGDAVEGFYRDGKWYYYPGTAREVQAGTSGADATIQSEAAYAYIQYCQAMYEKATTPEDKAYWHNEAEKTRARAGYSGGEDGSMYIPIAQLEVEQAIQDVLGQNNSSGSAATTPEAKMQALLDEWKAVALEQTNGQIDYAVAQAIKELERALEDAKPQFKETAESISMEERQAMDNAALYAELRGDKGGIGQEQYSSIQNTAAQNRLAVQQAQTKLATDTARQIEDLRAQGEFEKADKALEITQTYLAQLVSLEQWAAEYNLTQEQFQASLKQWEAEYKMAMLQIGIAAYQWKDEYDLAKDQFELQQDQFNYQKDQAALEATAEMGWTWFNAGKIDMITDEQLAAMKFNSREEAQAMYDALSSVSGTNSPDAIFAALYAGKYTKNSDPEAMTAYLVNRGVDAKLAPSYVTEFINSGYDALISSSMAPSDGWAAGYGNEVTGGSYKGSEWGAVKNTIVQNLVSGNFDAVTRYMDQIAGGLSEEQFLELMDLFNEYGYSPFSAIN